MGNELSAEEQARKELIESTYQARKKSLAFRTVDPSWPRQDKKQQDKPKEKKEPHVAAQQLLKGNLARGSHMYVFPDGKEAKVESNASFYAWNAWNYIGSSSGRARNVYSSSPYEEYRFFDSNYRPNFYQAYPLAALGNKRRFLRGKEQRNARLTRRIAMFGRVDELQDAQDGVDVDRLEYSKRYNNAASGNFYRQDNEKAKNPAYVPSRLVGCSLPYEWEAHHMLPQNVFYTYFTQEEIELILSSTYDINDGRNIVFLPGSSSEIYWKPHKLPHHVGCHPQYDQQVEDWLQSVKETLKEIKGRELPHPDAAGSIETSLHQAEQQAFVFIKNVGQRGPLKLS
ncbi:AHH domain-containing protein [Corallococcus terminator]|uniref:Uncharacterized protein n=1 Tax=Corallococcus terminator TaxID=2316733 RepID=A0A3A8I6I6_9BACT|nr:AHH domain-containing protein [Corallococcus terminator]RKG79057.1 hypothetical protein D7V88_29175 [Corallococcus terminator]